MLLRLLCIYCEFDLLSLICVCRLLNAMARVSHVMGYGKLNSAATRKDIELKQAVERAAVLEVLLAEGT